MILGSFRKRKVNVMDEEEYVAKVEKIIERDFFPELDKLKAQVGKELRKKILSNFTLVRATTLMLGRGRIMRP